MVLLFVLFFSFGAAAEFRVVNIGLHSESEHSTTQEDKKGVYSFCQDRRQRIVKIKIMEHLYKSYCDQVELEDLKEVRGLQFNDVTLTHINPEDLAGLENLTYLEFDNNSLKNISGDAFRDLVNLNHLIISNNLIETIDANTSNPLVRLKYLTLSNNLLEDIPEEFLASLENLKSLDLSHNLLTSLPVNDILSMLDLYYLNLSKNRFSEIDLDMFKPLRDLIALDLSYNSLHTLALGKINGIMRLNLSHNKLSDVDWSGVETLVECDISHNNLTHIPWALIESLPYLNVFHYIENPLESFLIHPKQDTYLTGADDEWSKCLLGMECAEYYAYIVVNGKQYRFTDCGKGKDVDSECYKLSQKWLNELNKGHSLLLELVEGRQLIQRVVNWPETS